jgi:hypothetical protein
MQGETRRPTRMSVAASEAPVTLLFEPWAREHEASAHSSVIVEWDNDGRDPNIEVVHYPDAIAFYADVLPTLWTDSGEQIPL